jgi:hypothetical protein
MEYTVLKLSTGDDLIGKADLSTNKNSSVLKIEEPFTMVTYVSDGGSTIVYLKRYQYLSDTTYAFIDKEHIVSQYVPNNFLMDYYDIMLQYTKEYIDLDMCSGINAATKVLKRFLENKNLEESTFSKANSFEELMNSLTTSKKKPH